MGRFVEQRWDENPSEYGGRKARQSFVYRAFIPDPIAGLHPLTSFETSGLVHEAERAVAALNEMPSLTGIEAVAPLLLRSEAVGSSKIERLAVTHTNLARALVDPGAARGAARAVAANVRALERAIALGTEERPLGVRDLIEVHRILMADDDPEGAGVVRNEQNWIGGRQPNPIDAVYIPPPPEEVSGLLLDFVTFLNRADLPAVAQAAMAHAQFETIHPFADGNGRVGRALIHLVLRRRGLTPRFVPPVSVVLGAHADAYVAGLTGYRDPDGLEPWLQAFARATSQAAGESRQLADSVRQLEERWLERAGRPRTDSTSAKIIRSLPAQPIITAATARLVTGTSYEAARVALNALQVAGVVRQISGGTYDRTYAADDLFDVVRGFELRLSGRATTEIDAPAL
jgi:Fic family protein